MHHRELGAADQQLLETVLGYLNFSSGAPEAKFLAGLNRLWTRFLPPEPGQPTWRRAGEFLRQSLSGLRGANPAFQDCGQAAAVLDLVFEVVIPGYLAFHRDLLYGQNEEDLFGPLAVGRVCEAVLREGPPWEERARICQGALGHLNDYVGYRPVAVLESRRIEPYAHERVRPVPLFIRGVGASAGRYQQLIAKAVEILEAADEDILRQACFDPALLDELALDPRIYDFDHPANKRPNHHFGLWDPHHLDHQGRYRRFVIQQVTLDALLERCQAADALLREELLFEAAAVLAGTMLMASGVSGSGPDTYDSNTTLANLLPRIAAYRDAFYERLIECLPPAHAQRLRQEAVERQQPFGAARQHLNAQLARRRASQLAHLQLAKIFARMGFPEAANEKALAVPVASARMLCQIECRLTAAQQAVSAHAPQRAASLLAESVDLLRRGIECGAIVDPWNILGFDAQFSLFPSPENSVPDHRIDELVELMHRLFHLHARAWSEAAALDEAPLCARIRSQFRDVADWWRQFAAHEVFRVEAVDAAEAYRAAERVARALNLWHKEGAATGNIGFWAPHAEMFDSPQSYALVIESLMDHADFVASMGLLVHWLGAAETIPLEQGEVSYHRLVERWLLEVRRRGAPTEGAAEEEPCGPVDGATWLRMRKFFDYLEANAGSFWHVPRWERAGCALPRSTGDGASAERQAERDEDQEDLFGAAYEDVVYHDSADDGVEGDLHDTSTASDDELVRESNRVARRLTFLATLSRLWRIAALSPLDTRRAEADAAEDRMRSLRRWAERAAENRRELLALLDAVHGDRIPPPRGNQESLLEYDRRLMVRESLLERIMATCVETADASRLLLAAAAASQQHGGQRSAPDTAAGRQGDEADEETASVRLLAAVLRHDRRAVRKAFGPWMATLAAKPLLYVPLARRGNPRAIVAARVRQRCLLDVLKCLPRLGLLVETCRLVEMARKMERSNPVGPGAVTEFDELFKAGWSALVECVVYSAKTWPRPEQAEDSEDASSSPLVGCLERLIEGLLVTWLAHSRTLRLSVLEKVNDRRAWNRLVSFIQRYGKDLFTQRFLNLGNLRAVLHQGVDAWLRGLAEEEEGETPFQLLDHLDREIPRSEAVERLTLILEAIVENYAEYRDYNSTTTQSDRGELLYTLLDFLRLRASYDRVCWNLQPVITAHEILVRSGCKQAAQRWRRALRERIRDEADKYEARLASLQKKYAMQMPSIADRIGERFVRPLVIDRLCALVRPALAEASRPGPHPAFRLLRYETEFLTREPSGVGFEAPAWLVALDEEVQRTRDPELRRDDFDELRAAVPPTALTRQEIERQIEAWMP